jgi:hypothetical protein
VLAGPDPIGDQALGDMLWAVTAGYAVEEYVESLRDGVTHAELVEVDELVLAKSLYLCDRRTGATHTEVLESYRLGIALADHQALLDLACTKAQIHQVATLTSSPLGYIEARDAGAAHDEAIAVATKRQLTILVYARLRRKGLTHAQANAELSHYQSKRPLVGT